MSAVPPTGTVSVQNMVNIWDLAAAPHPIGTKLRLNATAVGQYSPPAAPFPASNTSTFPLSKFRGVSRLVDVTFTATGQWTSTVQGTVSVLIVGGGGGGGPGFGGNPTNPSSLGGGGGAGGVVATSVSVAKGTLYPYSVGVGGSPASPFQTNAGATGGTTLFQATTASGGGGGGGGGLGPNYVNTGAGRNGGGSGGGGHAQANLPFNGGTGIQGNNGANGAGQGAGGGGGFGGTTSTCGGGSGYSWPVTGQTVAGGGGGSKVGPVSPPFSTAGGSGGGGSGGIFQGTVSITASTTYGGGGAGNFATSPAQTRSGGAGYPGCVRIRFG